MQKVLKSFLFFIFTTPVITNEFIVVGVVSDGVSPVTKKVIGYVKKWIF